MYRERHKTLSSLTQNYHIMQAWNVARHYSTAEQSSRNPAAAEHPLLHNPCSSQENPWFHASDHAIFSTIEREDDIFGGLSDIIHHHPHPQTQTLKNPISSPFVPRNDIITMEKSRGEVSGTKREPQELQQTQEAPTEAAEEVCANKRRRKFRPNPTRKTSAEMHNEYERKRRDRINEKIRTLRDLMPTCSSCHAASILEHAIEYLKAMKLQIQTMKAMTSTATYQYPWMLQPYVVSPFLSLARPSPVMSSVPKSVSVPSSDLEPSPSPGLGGDNVRVPQMQVSPICSQPLLTALLLSATNNGGSSANNSGNSLPNINQNMLQ